MRPEVCNIVCRVIAHTQVKPAPRDSLQVKGLPDMSVLVKQSEDFKKIVVEGSGVQKST